MKKIPVVVDVDTGVDDSMALLILAQDPRIDLLAAVSGFGNSTTDQTTRNTLNVLAMCGRSDVPVSGGASVPWKKPLRTSPYIHGDNGVGEFEFPENVEDAWTKEWAWDLAYRRIMESEEKVVYVALGSLTILATMLRKYPDVKARIDKVVYMGGEMRGNTAGSQCASVNIFHDPDAAGYVFDAGLEFYMCSGTHVTDHVLFAWPELEKWFSGDSLQDRAVLTMLKYYYDACSGFGENIDLKLSIHDAATVMFVLEPECFRSVKCHCAIELTGTQTYGYSLIDIYNIDGWDEKDFNIHYVYIRDEKTEYLKNEILRGIKGFDMFPENV